MQAKHSLTASFVRFGLGALLAIALIPQAQAQDKKADATGTWSWTMAGRNGGPDRKMSLKLKVEGDKVTGKLTTPGRDGTPADTDIQDGKIKGDEISFSVVREINGNKMTSKYTGKVTADSIKGKMETERNGTPQSRDWEAKRDAEKK